MMGEASTGWLGRRRFDIDAAVAGVLVALALLPLRFLSSDVYVETIPLVLGVACLGYLLAAYRGREEAPAVALSMAITGVLPGLVLAGVAAMVFVAVTAGERSPLFFDLAGVVGTLVVVQILFTDDRAFEPGFVLGEVVLLAAVVRFAALYTTPGYIGIDIWTHDLLVRRVLEAGSLVGIADNKHFVAPLYHLLVATLSLFGDVSLRTALYLSVGVLMPLSVLYVYAATKFLVPVRWAVFAAAAYAMGDYVIEWGLHLIPTSLGLVFFLGVVYALVRVMQTEYRARDFLLLVVLTLAVVFTHQVSSFIMLVFLGAGVVAQFLLNRDLFRASAFRSNVFGSVGPVNLVGLLVFDLGVLTFMWSFTPYKGDTFLETIGNLLVRTLFTDAGFLNLANPSSTPGAAAGRAPTFVEQLATYVDTTGFLLLLGTTIVGSLYVLRRSRAKHAAYTLVVATAIMGFFVFGLPLFGVRNFIPQRWFAFLYVGMAVLSAVGVRFLARRLSAGQFVAVVLVFALAFPSVMVMSSHGAIDNPVFPDQRARLAYTAPELAAVETIGTMTVSPDADVTPERTLYTDHPYQTVFQRTGAAPADPAVVVDGRPVDHHAVVWRAYQGDGASFFRDADDRGRIRDVPPERLCRPGTSTLYDNGPVRLCVAG